VQPVKRRSLGTPGWVVLLPALSGCTIEVTNDVNSFSLTVGLVAFVVANLLYLIWRWEGHPGEVRRSFAFLAGFPLSFLTFLLVEPNQQAAYQRAWLEEMKDDPQAVEADFQRELARVRRMRRVTPDGAASLANGVPSLAAHLDEARGLEVRREGTQGPEGPLDEVDARREGFSGHNRNVLHD